MERKTDYEAIPDEAEQGDLDLSDFKRLRLHELTTTNLLRITGPTLIVYQRSRTPLAILLPFDAGTIDLIRDLVDNEQILTG